MNFLAHAWLAGPDPADRLGGLIGDFVKGPLPADLPPAIAHGVRLHRQIDVYADSHPAFLTSRRRVSPERRRFAGVMVDMFYDHFLARLWDEFATPSLADFAAAQYALLIEAGDTVPQGLRRLLPRMIADDWLASYRDAEVIALALDRMALRVSRANPLPGAGTELLADYAGFEADFRAFLPDAREFARRQWQASA